MKKLRKVIKRQQQQRKIYFYERLAGKAVTKQLSAMNNIWGNPTNAGHNFKDISMQVIMNHTQRTLEYMWGNGVKI